jgi:hypothetical protein
MITPEPYLSAYLEVSKSAITYTRSIALENTHSLTNRLSKKRSEQVADLQDAIHVVLELLNEWERCDEPALRKNYLESYDRKWGKNEDDFSLLKIFNMVLRETNTKKTNP